MIHDRLPDAMVKEVPEYLKSDSCITPDGPLRPTQSNIGFFQTNWTTVSGSFVFLYVNTQCTCT